MFLRFNQASAQFTRVIFYGQGNNTEQGSHTKKSRPWHRDGISKRSALPHHETTKDHPHGEI